MNEQTNFDVIHEALACETTPPSAPKCLAVPKNGRSLTQTGKIILAVSLILSILFVTIGLIVNANQATKLTLNEWTYVPCERGDVIKLSFQPKQSDNYTLYVENGEILDINGEAPTIEDYYTGEASAVYMLKSQTYTIRVKATSSKAGCCIQKNVTQ